MAFKHDSTDPELAALIRLSGGIEGKRVLEIGCGNGRITQKYAAQASFVDAIDPNEEKIAKALASPSPPHVHYHPVALEDFQPSQPYDLIILAWSL